jgi:type I restriction enzyme S subunit
MSKMKFKPYRKYKNSGVEWIGEIPEHWRAERIKHVANVEISNIDKKSDPDEPEVLLCNYTDVYNNEFITSEFDFMKATASIGQISKLSLKKGDIVITKDSETANDIAVPALIDEDIDNLVCGYHLALLRPNNCDIKGRFLLRILQSKKINDQFTVSADGVTRFGISSYPIKNSYLIIPPIEEQNKISEYIDQETSQINAINEKYEKLIELLKEKRIALISNAVTKGLNPDVKMKDSGVEWIGEIPDHWEVKKIGYIANKIGSGKTPKGGSEIYINEGVMLIRSQNVYDEGLLLDDVAYIDNEIDEEMSQTRLKENDLLLNITGASIGRTNTVPANILPANVNQHVCIIRLRNGLFTQYVSYCLKSKIVKHQIFSIENGTSREGLNFPQVKNLVLILPNNIAEQEEIADYLNQETSRIDQLIEKINKQIDQLSEYKTSLISHAVTGKIDVRQLI